MSSSPRPMSRILSTALPRLASTILQLRTFRKFLLILTKERPNVVSFLVERSTVFSAAFIAIFGWFVSSLQFFNVHTFIFLLPFAAPILTAWDKSDYYTEAVSHHTAFTLQVTRGHFFGNKTAFMAKDVLKAVTFGIFVIVDVLIFIQFDFGVTLSVLGIGFLTLIDTLVLGFLTRKKKHIHFTTPPRKRRQQALQEIAHRLLQNAEGQLEK